METSWLETKAITAFLIVKLALAMVDGLGNGVVVSISSIPLVLQLLLLLFNIVHLQPTRNLQPRCTKRCAGRTSACRATSLQGLNRNSSMLRIELYRLCVQCLILNKSVFMFNGAPYLKMAPQYVGSIRCAAYGCTNSHRTACAPVQ